MRRKAWIGSPIFYLMGIVMLIMSILSLKQNKILFAVEFTVSVLLISVVLMNDMIFHRKISVAMRSARKLLASSDGTALEEFQLPIAVVDHEGTVLMTNREFRQSLALKDFVLSESIQKFIFPKTVRQILSSEVGVSVSHKDKKYSVYGLKLEVNNILFFVDDTDYKSILKESREKLPTVCTLKFDNKEEMVRGSAGGEESRITAAVDEVIRSWGIKEMGGFMKRLADGRYLVLTDDKHLEEAKKKRFQVLDAVREVKGTEEHMSATVSIGIGKGASDIAESERFSRQALEMALGRGGDQVAVLQKGDSYEFFGGLSKGVEKRDKVRTRVIAATIADHVKSSDRVFIMGHKNSDLDSVGSAVGMWAVAKKGIGKPAYIVIQKQTTLAGSLVKSIEDNYKDEKVFISPAEAIPECTKGSLLIIVDTHSFNFVESLQLLNRTQKVIVIDHHRMMVTRIKEALVFYHEPYASSAAEMVTEIVQYIKSSAINAIDAQALLAGIMLDTKSFVMKTGVRTFEASAFLRRRGADTVEVKQLFSNTLEAYKEKSRLVSEAEIHHSCAIASSSLPSRDLRIAAAQAADELLSIQGVKASFVLYKVENDVSISARSLGDINVQVILERFGGGGHFTMAGAQIKNITVYDAKRALVKELDSKIDEMLEHSQLTNN